VADTPSRSASKTLSKTAKTVAELPGLVARYVERAQATGSPERVRITQDGRMWMKLGGRALSFTATEDFEVGRVDAGDIVRASSKLRRYEGEATPWGGEYSDHAVLDGIRLPTAAEVYWELESGRFVYWRGRVLTATGETAGTRP
jgi:hypothetical protein